MTSEKAKTLPNLNLTIALMNDTSDQNPTHIESKNVADHDGSSPSGT